MNEFAADLGTYLMGNGVKPDVDLTFNGILVTHIGTPDGTLFCSTSNTSMDGRQYALTLDMDRAQLDELFEFRLWSL